MGCGVVTCYPEVPKFQLPQSDPQRLNSFPGMLPDTVKFFQESELTTLPKGWEQINLDQRGHQ